MSQRHRCSDQWVNGWDKTFSIQHKRVLHSWRHFTLDVITQLRHSIESNLSYTGKIRINIEGNFQQENNWETRICKIKTFKLNIKLTFWYPDPPTETLPSSKKLMNTAWLQSYIYNTLCKQNFLRKENKAVNLKYNHLVFSCQWILCEAKAES